MWTDSTEAHELIAELSKKIVTDVAVEELELFDELAQDYFANPQPAGKPSDAPDDALGFGLETLAAVTPVALAMVQTVVIFLATEVVKVARDEAAKVVISKVKSYFWREKPTLSTDQLQRVRELSRQQALQFGLSKEAAESLAQALIGSLVLHD